MVTAEHVGYSLRCHSPASQGVRDSNTYRHNKGKTKPPVSALFYPFFIPYLQHVKISQKKSSMTHKCSSKENPVLLVEGHCWRSCWLNVTAPGEDIVSWSTKRYWAEARHVFGCCLLQPCFKNLVNCLVSFYPCTPLFFFFSSSSDSKWAVYLPKTVPLIE